MKWMRRLMLTGAVALFWVALFAAVAVYLYHGTPRYYRTRVATDEEVKDAANRADQKLIDLFSWAADARAQLLRKIHGKARDEESSVGTKTITLDEDEINSFAGTWSSEDKRALAQRISHYFTDGRIVLGDQSIILVGQSPALGTLGSMKFIPTLRPSGNLHLDLDSLRAGLLPIPKSAVANQLTRLKEILEDQIADEQPYVYIGPGQTASGAALGASWLHLLICSLSDQSTLPYLIIPFDLSNLNHGFPVKLTGLNITEGRIELTFDTLSRDEVRQFERILQPQ